MNRRFRTVGALLALSALSASYAEGLWASTTCLEMEGMAASMGAEPIASVGPDAMAAMPGMDPSMSGSSTLPDRGRTDGGSRPTPDCPVTAVAGSCTAVSFPTPELRIGFGSVSRTSSRPGPDASPELILSTSLLRPPRV